MHHPSTTPYSLCQESPAKSSYRVLSSMIKDEIRSPEMLDNKKYSVYKDANMYFITLYKVLSERELEIEGGSKSRRRANEDEMRMERPIEVFRIVR